MQVIMDNWVSIVSILAIIVSPIVALNIAEIISVNRERSGRKYAILSDLMATRRSRLDGAHIKALNLIELEFYDVPQVRSAYRSYVENLSAASPTTDQGWDVLVGQRHDLFAELLRTIASHLDYSFDKSDLSRLGYSPQAHEKYGDNQLVISSLMRDVLEGKRALPIAHLVQDQKLFPPTPKPKEIEDKRE